MLAPAMWASVTYSPISSGGRHLCDTNHSASNKFHPRQWMELVSRHRQANRIHPTWIGRELGDCDGRLVWRLRDCKQRHEQTLIAPDSPSTTPHRLHSIRRLGARSGSLSARVELCHRLTRRNSAQELGPVLHTGLAPASEPRERDCVPLWRIRVKPGTMGRVRTGSHCNKCCLCSHDRPKTMTMMQASRVANCNFRLAQVAGAAAAAAAPTGARSVVDVALCDKQCLARP
jgi:hypothetical protein